MAEQLGILNVYNQKIIEKLENNINDKEKIVQIISETFMNSDAYLSENQRYEVGIMILIGGWIEGIYIATKLTDKNPEKNIQLTNNILKQKLSLELMTLLFNDFKSKNEQFNTIQKELIELFDIFNKAQKNVTSNDLVVNKKDFETICLKIEKIRNKIVNVN